MYIKRIIYKLYSSHIVNDRGDFIAEAYHRQQETGCKRAKEGERLFILTKQRYYSIITIATNNCGSHVWFAADVPNSVFTVPIMYGRRSYRPCCSSSAGEPSSRRLSITGLNIGSTRLQRSICGMRSASHYSTISATAFSNLSRASTRSQGCTWQLSKSREHIYTLTKLFLLCSHVS